MSASSKSLQTISTPDISTSLWSFPSPPILFNSCGASVGCSIKNNFPSSSLLNIKPNAHGHISRHPSGLGTSKISPDNGLYTKTPSSCNAHKLAAPPAPPLLESPNLQNWTSKTSLGSASFARTVRPYSDDDIQTKVFVVPSSNATISSCSALYALFARAFLLADNRLPGKSIKIFFFFVFFSSRFFFSSSGIE